MKAVVCPALSPDLGAIRIEDITLPPLKMFEARVRVRAAAVNFPDVLMAQGKYQHKPELPFVMGTEGAGEVVEVGTAVTHVAPGDRVVIGGLGCFAEEVQIPAQGLRQMPPGADFAVASGFTVAYLTAYVALVRRAQIKPGEWLLVHGGGGGTGLAAIDLGKALGARVIATASSDEKREAAKKMGADFALRVRDFREEVKAITSGRGADVIFDPVGGSVFAESCRCIAFDGRLLVIGFTSGNIPELPINIALIKGFSVMGVRAGEYGRQFPEKGRENLAAIDKLLADGRIKPYIGARFPLDRAVDAMRMLLDRQAIGKVVIEP